MAVPALVSSSSTASTASSSSAAGPITPEPKLRHRFSTMSLRGIASCIRPPASMQDQPFPPTKPPPLSVSYVEEPVGGAGRPRLLHRVSIRNLQRWLKSESPVDRWAYEEPVPPIPDRFLGGGAPPAPRAMQHGLSPSASPAKPRRRPKKASPYGCERLAQSACALGVWGSGDPSSLPPYRATPAVPAPLPPAAFDPSLIALPLASLRFNALCFIDMTTSVSSGNNALSKQSCDASSGPSECGPEAGDEAAKPPLATSTAKLSLSQPPRPVHLRTVSSSSIPMPARDDKALHHRPTSGTGAEVYADSDTEGSTAPNSPKAADQETRAAIRAAKEEEPIGEREAETAAAAATAALGRVNGTVPPTSGHAMAAAKLFGYQFFNEAGAGSGSALGIVDQASNIATPGNSEGAPPSTPATMSRESSSNGATTAGPGEPATAALPQAGPPLPEPRIQPAPVQKSPKRPAIVKAESGAKGAELRPPINERKSMFGKFFDKRESGGESDSASAMGKMMGRKPSAKKLNPTGQPPANGDVPHSGGVEANGSGAAMARQPSGGPVGKGQLVRAPSDKSTNGAEEKSSKLREMVGMAPKLGRKPSSSKGARSDDGKSDDDGKSRAGSQATTSLLKKYGVCEKAAIGKGATAVVRLAHKWDRGTDKLYAVKEFRKRRKGESEREYVKKLTSEFCISSTLHHGNVVETVDLVQDENHHWCEVMEYCPGGDLYGAIKRGNMSIDEINSYFKQMLSGVAYLHSMGVAHRDIKPENLLLDAKGNLKITDFGVSDVFRMCWEKTTHLSKGLCGSEPYLPKEMFERKEYDARLVDVWACAIVYYCCCMQELPWRVAKASDPSFGAFLQAYGQTAPAPLANLHRESRPLIKKLLQPEPENRPQMEAVMADPWVKGLVVIEVVVPTYTVREKV